MIDAIIVPGRGIEHDGTLTPDSMSRVRKAVELHLGGQATRIIMSGAYSRHLTDIPATTEAEAMRGYAVQLGCDPGDVLSEDESTHTLANAYFTKKRFCEPNNWHNLMVVASDEHLPRIRYVFGKVFGPEYTIEGVESNRVINDQEYAKEQQHEADSMVRTRQWLDVIPDGDDQAIRRLVAAHLPDDPMAKSL